MNTIERKKIAMKFHNRCVSCTIAEIDYLYNHLNEKKFINPYFNITIIRRILCNSVNAQLGLKKLYI